MLQTSLRGGFAGAVATVVMPPEPPLDKRLFDSRYDDVEILGKLVTRGDDWQPIGFALHVQSGAILGAGCARLSCVLRQRSSGSPKRCSVPAEVAPTGFAPPPSRPGAVQSGR